MAKKIVKAKSKPMPKAKGKPVARSVKKAPARKAPAKRRSAPKAPAPYLTSKGTVSRKAGLNPWLTKTGKLDKRKKLPKGVRGLNSLYTFQQKQLAEKQKRATKRKKVAAKAAPSRATGKARKPTRAGKGTKEKVQKPWLNKDGTLNHTFEIAEWLTEDGKLDKRKKLPKGVKTIDQLFDYLRARKVTAKSKWVQCEDFILPIWEFKKMLDATFDAYKKVHMGGKKISWNTWNAYGDDYIANQTNAKDSPPSIAYQICRDKLYKYLFF